MLKLWSVVPLVSAVLMMGWGCSSHHDGSDDGNLGGAPGAGGSSTIDECEGCRIDESCVPEGTENPENACEVCSPSLADDDWSSRENGTTCSDGKFCTAGDTCQDGICEGGDEKPCGDDISCNGEETCDEENDECSPGTSTCDEGSFCDLDADECSSTCAGCAIDGVCYPDGALNPQNLCEMCLPNESDDAFSAVPDGTTCDDGLFCNGSDSCRSGTCEAGSATPCDDSIGCNGEETCNEDTNTCSPGASPCDSGTSCNIEADACLITCAGCVVDGICYANGSPNPQNACEVCEVATSTIAFTAVADGVVCENGVFCDGVDTCQAGVCTAPGTNPCDDGIACNGSETCSETLNQCTAGAPSCGPGLACVPETDSCDVTCAGCIIEGICYPEGAKNPENACEACVTATSAVAFSAIADGTVCDNGAFCDGTDTCQSGVCTAPNINPCDDGASCNGGETCSESSDSCRAGMATCGAGLVCSPDTDSCGATCAGCLVNGVCHADGSTNPTNSCEVCDADVDATHFVAVSDGIACDNGAFCDGSDTCLAGVCTAPNTNPCDDAVSCNGTETCNETTNKCGAGVPTCGAGLSCSPDTDSCESTCAGCLVNGVCYAQGSSNPTNGCEVCNVSQSTSSFVSATDGALCTDGLFCNGMDSCQSGVCTPTGTNPCNDGVSCNGTETCNETSDMCGAGATTCSTGQYCDTSADSCTATCNGCSISGVCYPDGIANPTNACEVCNVAASSSTWTGLADGTSCGYNAVCGGTTCGCVGGWIETGGYCTTHTITAMDETWSGDVFVGIQSTIPKVNLLANDVNNVGQNSELSIVAVKDAVNGTVTMSGANVLFTGTAAGSGSFVYVVQAGTDPSTQVEVKVSFTVQAAPPVIAVADSRSVQQGEQLPITTASLLTNDVGNSLTVVSVQNPIRGTVSLSGTAITFVSTGIAGEPAEFEYTVQDNLSNQATGKVYITATPLPGVEGYIYDDYALFDSKRTTYTPPTVRSIFDTWGRFNENVYYAGGTAAAGTAASWTLIADEDNDGNIDGDLDGDTVQDNKTSFVSSGQTINGDINGDGTFDARFMQTANGVYNGFVSPQSYDTYTHEVTLWSLDPDNDMVGVMIAYDTGGGAGTLHVDRTAGGWAPNQGWGLMVGKTVLVNLNINGTGTGWSGRASRVKVIRQGDLIQVYCTNWMTSAASFFTPPAYNPDSLIEIDLSTTTNNIRYSVGGTPMTASADLTRFRGAHPYGYVNESQALTSYIDVRFDGGIQSDVLVYLTSKQPGLNIWDDSEVWRYTSGSWNLTSESVQDVFGFVRPVTEPGTGNIYQVRQTEVEKL